MWWVIPILIVAILLEFIIPFIIELNVENKREKLLKDNNLIQKYKDFKDKEK